MSSSPRRRGFLAIVVVVGADRRQRGSSGGGDASNIVGSRGVDQLLAGIPQKAMVLGEPGAKVEADRVRRPAVPDLQRVLGRSPAANHRKPGQDGEAKLDFRNFMIIGPQSIPAGAAAIAAGEQGRGWNFIELFYRNQGEENSGYVTDEFLDAIAKARRRQGHRQMEQGTQSQAVKEQVEATTAEAEKLGFTGTPSFAIEGPGADGTEVIGTPESADALEAAIENAGK